MIGIKKEMLAKKLREILRKIQPIVGYNAKIVEEAGRKLRHLFCNTNPWKGQARVQNMQSGGDQD